VDLSSRLDPRRRLVERRPDERERRVKAVHLTAARRALVETLF
jgi:DNA-binding MarR family transcriptional regulator